MECRSPLHEAAAAGDLELTKKLLQDRADVEAVSKGDNGGRALHLACRNNHAAVVATLLRHGADIAAPDANGWGPLHEASFHGHPEVIKVLVAAGADIEAKNQCWTPLMRAALWGHTAAVDTLLDLGADPDAQGSFNYTAVHYAASRGHIEALGALQRHGATLGQVCANHGNAVHSAAGGGRLATVMWLKGQGVTHNLRDKNQRSPEDMAQIYGYHHVAYWLNKQDLDPDPFTHSQMDVSREESERMLDITLEWVRTGNVHSLRIQLPIRPYRIHYQDAHGWTPLHWAAHANQAGAAEVLVEMGALRAALTLAGETPWQLAQRAGHAPLPVLVTPPHALSKRQRVRLYGRLLRAVSGAELIADTSGLDGRTSMDTAEVQKRREAVLEVSRLVDQGCPVEPLGGHTVAALHLAVTANCTDLVPLLLGSGAPLTTTTGGMSVLQLAWQCRDVTTNIAVTVTRAFLHTLEHELRGVGWECPQDEALLEGLRALVAAVRGPEPWLAAWPLDTRDGPLLTGLLARACRWGATLTASFIQRAGGSTTTLSEGGSAALAGHTSAGHIATGHTSAGHIATGHTSAGHTGTALHAALAAGQTTTARCLVLHMSANVFIADARGVMPVDMLPREDRLDLMEELLSQDYRKLSVLREKVKNQRDRRMVSSIMILLAALYGDLDYSDLDPGKVSASPSCSWEANFAWLMTLLDRVWLREDAQRESDEAGTFLWLSELLLEVNQDLETDWQVLSADQDQLEDFENEEELFCQLIEAVKIRTVSSDVDFLDSMGENTLETAFLYSIENSLPFTLHLIIAVARADINQVLEPLSGATPLHVAAWRGRQSTCEYLLSQGADRSRRDSFGNTPAHLAFMFGHSVLGSLVLPPDAALNAAGRTPHQMYANYKHYCGLYGYNDKASIKLYEKNDATALLKARLKHFQNTWRSMTKAVQNLHVDFTKGEAETIRSVLIKELNTITERVGKVDKRFEATLLMLGSSADNLRLYSPDEFDCNIELKNISGFEGGGLKVELESVPPSRYRGYSKYVKVTAETPELRNLIGGSEFIQAFFCAITEALKGHSLADQRLSFLPPGVMTSGVGVTLSLAWQGDQYPLLFIDVDLVPTIRAPWPHALPKPVLTPAGVDAVHACKMSDDEWRFSFASTENLILKNLSWPQRRAFLACKLLLSALKSESWAPRDTKDEFTYWDGHRYKIPSPTGFMLKAAFMHEVETCPAEEAWGDAALHQRMCSIFGRMCVCEVDGDGGRTFHHARLTPYFGGDAEKPLIGHGAPQIIRFLEEWRFDS